MRHRWEEFQQSWGVLEKLGREGRGRFGRRFYRGGHQPDRDGLARKAYRPWKRWDDYRLAWWSFWKELALVA